MRIASLSIAVLASIASTISFASLNPFGTEIVSWHEEVEVRPSSTVEVTRAEELHDTSHGLATARLNKQQLEFVDPVTHARVTWEHLMYLTPIALIVEDAAPVIITIPDDATGRAQAEYGCNGTPYYVFRYEREQWNYIPNPAELRYRGPGNLYYGMNKRIRNELLAMTNTGLGVYQVGGMTNDMVEFHNDYFVLLRNKRIMKLPHTPQQWGFDPALPMNRTNQDICRLLKATKISLSSLQDAALRCAGTVRRDG